MWNTPTRKQLDLIPRLYETEHIPVEEKVIHLHFFLGGCDWYIAERNPCLGIKMLPVDIKLKYISPVDPNGYCCIMRKAGKR